MKDNKTTLYKHNECKTEFLFESDAEKVVLKEALKPKKKKTYKLVLINCFLICLFLTILSFSLTSYKNQELSKISASINQIKAKKELNEKLNKSSDNLKKVNNDYNKKYEIIVLGGLYMRKFVVWLLFNILKKLNPSQREFLLFKILRVKE